MLWLSTRRRLALSEALMTRGPPDDRARGSVGMLACSALAGRKLRVGHWIDEVSGRSLVREADHRAVDVDADAPIGCAAGAGNEVGTSRGEVEDDVLVDLPLVETLIDRLLRPLTELRVPERAVRVRVSWVLERGEIAEHVQQVAPVAQRVDQRGVRSRGVLCGVAVKNDVLEALRLWIVGSGLPVDEAEQALA